MHQFRCQRTETWSFGKKPQNSGNGVVWLVPFMRDDKPKFLTKAELREAALRELGVSKSAFDSGWIEAIEQTGRHDWYEPLRRRPRSKN
jgi:hypothetical protein